MKINKKKILLNAQNDRDTKPVQNKEKGRSMTEMLGVLAVIGVLSVAGIIGYKSAMIKHKANNLLDEVSKRAVVVAGQLIEGSEASISDFDNENVAGLGFGFNEEVFLDGDLFTIETKGDGVDKEICEKVFDQIGDRTIVRLLQCGGEDVNSVSDCKKGILAFTFNKELTTDGLGFNKHGDDEGNCDPGYIGDDCREKNTDCSGHGSWSGSSCNCDAGYVGNNCESCDEGYTKNDSGECEVACTGEMVGSVCCSLNNPGYDIEGYGNENCCVSVGRNWGSSDNNGEGACCGEGMPVDSAGYCCTDPDMPGTMPECCELFGRDTAMFQEGCCPEGVSAGSLGWYCCGTPYDGTDCCIDVGLEWSETEGTCCEYGIDDPNGWGYGPCCTDLNQSAVCCQKVSGYDWGAFWAYDSTLPTGGACCNVYDPGYDWDGNEVGNCCASDYYDTEACCNHNRGNWDSTNSVCCNPDNPGYDMNDNETGSCCPTERPNLIKDFYGMDIWTCCANSDDLNLGGSSCCPKNKVYHPYGMTLCCEGNNYVIGEGDDQACCPNADDQYTTDDPCCPKNKVYRPYGMTLCCKGNNYVVGEGDDQRCCPNADDHYTTDELCCPKNSFYEEDGMKRCCPSNTPYAKTFLNSEMVMCCGSDDEVATDDPMCCPSNKVYQATNGMRLCCYNQDLMNGSCCGGEGGKDIHGNEDPRC